MTNIDNTAVSTHLGKISEYKNQYDKTLLVREPRSSNRVHLDIKDDQLPFLGFDTWNNYEVSALTFGGLPVTGIAKIVYPCESKYIVESKSLKLYFNSFNMTQCGGNAKSVLAQIEKTVQTDLSELLETTVDVSLFDNKTVLWSNNYFCNPKSEWGHKDNDTTAFQTVEEEYNLNNLNFDVYDENPELLEVVKTEKNTVKYHSTLLRSRCRVTNQPDTGDVYVTMVAKQTIDPISFLKYVVSFRNECHFHEEICETIYKRIWDILKPEKLSVRCLYARRGGIDINPERASHKDMLHNSLCQARSIHIKTPKQ